MRKPIVFMTVFAVLGLFLISSSFADIKRVKTYDEYVASLEEGYEPVPRECFDQAMKEGQLNIYDWAAWWDEDLYNDFSKIFGIKIVRDNFANYEEMLTKYKLNPNLKYDFVIPGPRAFDQMKAIGLVSKLNHDWLPNVNKNIRPSFKQMAFDPGYQYTILYGLSMAGYIVNTSFVDKKDPRLGHWAFLFEAPKDLPSHGKLVIRDNMYSVIGAALQYLGYSLNSVDEKELMEAKKALLDIKP
jgi:spermidine/putrescine transport system substrate-binding protein